MKKAAICIDEWKLEIFTEELKADGYEFEKHAGVTADTLTLTVWTDSADRLKTTVARAQKRCARRKMN